MKTSDKIRRWKDRLKNVPCFIIGTAPSLLDISEEEKSRLNDCFTIGINRAFEFVVPTILLWLDEGFGHEFAEQIEPLPSIKLNQTIEDPDNKTYVFQVKNRQEGYNLPDNFDCFFANFQYMNSAAIAFQIAVLLGCSPIILLGIDGFYRRAEGTKRGVITNFFGVNHRHDTFSMPNCMTALKFIKDSHQTVLNCADNNFFHKHSLSEVFNLIKVDTNRDYKKCLLGS